MSTRITLFDFKPTSIESSSSLNGAVSEAYCHTELLLQKFKQKLTTRAFSMNFEPVGSFESQPLYYQDMTISYGCDCLLVLSSLGNGKTRLSVFHIATRQLKATYDGDFNNIVVEEKNQVQRGRGGRDYLIVASSSKGMKFKLQKINVPELIASFKSGLNPLETSSQTMWTVKLRGIKERVRGMCIEYRESSTNLIYVLCEDKINIVNTQNGNLVGVCILSSVSGITFRNPNKCAFYDGMLLVTDSITHNIYKMKQQGGTTTSSLASHFLLQSKIIRRTNKGVNYQKPTHLVVEENSGSIFVVADDSIIVFSKDGKALLGQKEFSKLHSVCLNEVTKELYVACGRSLEVYK